MAKYALTVLVAGLFLPTVPAAEEKKDDAKKDQEALQGTWKVVSFERDGKPIDDAKGLTMTFDKDAFVVKMGEKELAKGTLKIDRLKTPKVMEMTLTEGKEKGKQAHAIYELTKDGLKWCSADAGQDGPPKKFSTTEGGGHVLMTLEKEKK